jgi:N-methylhydantoinase A/acetophenone carboxylase
MDIMHIYEYSRRYMLMEPGTKKFNTKYQEFNDAVEVLYQRAKRELAGEGLPIDRAVFRLELDMLYGGQVHRKRSSSPMLYIRSEKDIQTIYDAFEKEFSETFSPLVVHPEGGVYVESFVLTASIPAEKPSVPTYPDKGLNPSAALKGKRPCYWGNGGFMETPVSDYDKLMAGNEVIGPCIFEAEYTTTVIPPGFRCRIDQHLFGQIEKA